MSFGRIDRLAAKKLAFRSLWLAPAVAVAVLACSPERILPRHLIELGEVEINGGPATLERGTRDTLTATTLDQDGDTVDVPVVWASSNERVAVFERGGVLVALDTGTTTVSASSLGVVSTPVPYTVVWLGPASIDSGTFAPSNARGPGVALADSVRVVVRNSANAPVANVKVAFTVTAGGGSVSPQVATTNATGVAATRWTTGPVAGMNTVTASAVLDDGTPYPFVVDNLVTYTINTYNAVTAVDGDGQTGQILSDLAIAPSVKLVDSLGVPRSGVPVTFTAFANGRVVSPVVSTGADGVASPGKWTLGDIPGAQMLEARVEDARAVLNATATGTPILYTPAAVAAGGFATCAREPSGVVKCWGSHLHIGTGDTIPIATPKAIQGSITATSVTGSAAQFSHFCALTSVGEAWCWGRNAFVDTTGANIHAPLPARLQSDLAWAQISPGAEHNCGITVLGAAYCWGMNNFTSTGEHSGQLGDGTTTPRAAPTLVSGGFTFSTITAGVNHSCGLVSGEAFCWGQNQAGQLGDASTQARLGPTRASGGLTFETIGAGQNLTCGLTPQPEGKVYCWGNITGLPQTTPTAFANAPSFVSLTVGGGHACALTADASAYCWGGNLAGQLGDSSRTTRPTPTRVAGTMRFTQLSAGLGHTCGITTAGAAACWGANSAFELGDSTVAFRTVPRHVILGVNP